MLFSSAVFMGIVVCLPRCASAYVTLPPILPASATLRRWHVFHATLRAGEKSLAEHSSFYSSAILLSIPSPIHPKDQSHVCPKPTKVIPQATHRAGCHHSRKPFQRSGLEIIRKLLLVGSLIAANINGPASITTDPTLAPSCSACGWRWS